MVNLSFFGQSISDIKYWVTFATYFRHQFFFIASVELLQTLRLLQKVNLYYYYSKVFHQTQQKKFTRENCETQIKRNIFWHYMRCSTGTLQFTQCPNFSTTSRLASLYFFNFLNWPLKLDCTFPPTTFRWFWTIKHSWKLEIISLQVTSYKASFGQFPPEISTHYSS